MKYMAALGKPFSAGQLHMHLVRDLLLRLTGYKYGMKPTTLVYIRIIDSPYARSIILLPASEEIVVKRKMKAAEPYLRYAKGNLLVIFLFEITWIFLEGGFLI